VSGSVDILRKISEKATERIEHPTPKHKKRLTAKMYNPLTTPLPRAPRMRIYCGYGHGVKTERAYHYRHVNMPTEEDQCPAMELGTDLAPDQVRAACLCEPL
jgi:Lecithin:cholesterol acyltransferase